MKTKKRKTLLAVIRSMALALIILVLSTWLIIGVCYEVLGEKIKYDYPDNWLSHYWDIVVLILYNLTIVIACFYIVKQNPTSIWYVPLICNAYVIASVFTEPSTYWIIFCCGLILSIISSIMGVRKGQMVAVSDNT